MSNLGDLYNKAYDLLCGKHPNIRPWHFQWLSGHGLYSDFARLLPALSGRVLDVGCGHKPYASWMTGVSEYVGLDSFADNAIDIVVSRDGAWPLSGEYFDSILCTQVLEHVENLDHMLDEMHRVLKTNGTLLISVPFLYNVHGLPLDFRRFTVQELYRQFSPRYDVVELKSQGGIGSTLGLLCLNWIDDYSNRHIWAGILKGGLLPLWVLVSLMVNMACLVLDSIDDTDAFYYNSVLLARKKSA